MGHLHTDGTTRGQLRLVFGDRVVSRWLGSGTTLGDVAAVLNELEPRRYGDAVAINVTMVDFPGRSSSSPNVPAELKYEDDPAAEFEDMAPRSAFFDDPDHAVRVRMSLGTIHAGPCHQP